MPRQADQQFDGVSILPALKGESFERGAVFQYFPHSPGVPDWLPPCVSVHRDDWKLIRIFHGGGNGLHRYMLFNLRDDIGEQNNLAAAKPELVAELDNLIELFLAKTNAIVPVPNPAFNPSQYKPEFEGKQTPKVDKKPKNKSAPGVKPAEANASSTWRSSKDVVLNESKNRLSLKSSGGDPWISTRALPQAQGPFVVVLRMSSTTKGAGVIFFLSENDKGFHKDRSEDFSMTQDGEFHDYEIEVPAKDLIALRLDPGNSPGDIAIERFNLRDATGKNISLLK